MYFCGLERVKKMKKIAVFGVGHLGRIHCKCIQQSPSMELAGIYDVDFEKAKQTAKELDTTAYEHPDDLFADCDIADIVTTTSEHHAVAKQAINQGKHVFIEKPVCVTLEEAKELIQLSEEKGVMVQVGHVERFNPAFVAAQPFIGKPMFIESHRLAFFNPRGNDVSVVLDLMIHDIDIILKMTNSELVDIHASGVPIVTDTFDIANVRLAFANGCVANLTASRISLKNMRKIRLFQENAYISIDLLDKKTEIVRLEQDAQSDENSFALELDLGAKGKKKIIIESPEIEPINAIQTELESFVSAIENKTTPIVTLQDGYASLETAYRIIAKMNESIK